MWPHRPGPLALGRAGLPRPQLVLAPRPPPRWGLCPAGSAAGSSAPMRPSRAAPPPRGPRSSQSPVGSKERLSLSLHVPLAPAPQAVRAPCSVVTLIRPPSSVLPKSGHLRPRQAFRCSLPEPACSLPPASLPPSVPYSLFSSFYFSFSSCRRAPLVACDSISTPQTHVE